MNKKIILIVLLCLILPLISQAGITPWIYSGQALTERVRAFAVYKNKLYLGQDYGGIYRYEGGTTWTNVCPNCTTASATSLLVFNKQLYAGPNFDGHVWRWDNGVWFDTGMAGQGCCYNTVHALQEYNGWLYAGKVDGKIFRYREGHFPAEATPID